MGILALFNIGFETYTIIKITNIVHFMQISV